MMNTRSAWHEDALLIMVAAGVVTSFCHMTWLCCLWDLAEMGAFLPEALVLSVYARHGPWKSITTSLDGALFNSRTYVYVYLN